MRIFNKLRGTKGFISTWERVIRFRYMITEQAKERCRILAFWERHGTEATIEAFRTSKRTLFRWQNSLRKTQGKLEGLNTGSRSPHTKRKRVISEEVKRIIIEERTKVPRLGKEKIKVILERKGYILSVSTTGRIIKDLKTKGLLPRIVRMSMYASTGNVHEKQRVKRKKYRRPKEYDHCVEIDTIVRFVDGIKRYTLTAVDCRRKFAFAFTYKNHSSGSASDFVQKLLSVVPFEIKSIQTDNGSEFACYFEDILKKQNIKHFHIYPHTPKMNAFIERFNRTLDDEFIKCNRSLLRDDLNTFNLKLIEYLIWFNTERPHHSLSLLSPMQYIISTLPERECHMLWTDTST